MATTPPPSRTDPQEWQRMNDAAVKDCRVAALERRVDFLTTQHYALVEQVHTLARTLGGILR